MPDPFTKKEDGIIRKWYGKIPIRSKLREKLWGRSEGQIAKRIRELGLESGNFHYLHHFSAQDIEYLQDNYETASWEEMTKALDRTKESIAIKANKIGLKRTNRKVWSQFDTDFLAEKYKEIPIEDLSEIMGKSERAIKCKLKRMGLE
jgi:hypothetical protein